MWFAYCYITCVYCLCHRSAIIGRNVKLFMKHVIKFAYAMPAVS